MCSTNEKMAFYKLRPTRSLPPRAGPIQCIRNCPHCILQQRTYREEDFEDLLPLKCFDDLVARQSFLAPRFHTIQYHIGQLEVLKKAIDHDATSNIIYIVAVTRSSDVNYLNMVFDHAKFPKVLIIANEGLPIDLIKVANKRRPIALPIQLRSCSTSNSFMDTDDSPCFSAKALRSLLEPFVNAATKDRQFNATIVPVVITKELDGLKLYGLGSLCVQILEPYSLQTYMSRIETRDISTHFVQHLYFDISSNSVLLPSHLVAYLMLYLDRVDGVSFDDLTNYFTWFRKTSTTTGMQLGFTGTNDKAIQYAFIVLKDFIHFESRTLYRAKNVDRLKDYADLVTPLFAYQGLLARAILLEYNNTIKDYNEIQTNLTSALNIQLDKDKVIEICADLAEIIERRLPCRRPCQTIETNIENIISQMQLFGHYIKIQEPKRNQNRLIGWAAELDDDDDYYSNRNDPALKTWIILTRREYRIDRLNLFINAIDSHL